MAFRQYKGVSKYFNSDNNGFVLYLCLLLQILLTGVQCQTYYYAEQYSRPLVLNCTASSQTAELMWMNSPSGGTNTQYVATCTMSSNNPSPSCNYYYQQGNYTLTPTPPIYSLGINPLNTVTSTKYVCTSLSTTGSQTAVTYYTIALEPLKCPQSGTVVAEGTVVHIPCSAVYYQYTADQSTIVRPVLSWSNALNNNVNSMATINTTLTQTIYTINVTMTSEYDSKPFFCNLSMPSITGSGYRDSCQVTYYIQHGVTAASIGLPTVGSTPPTLYIGDVLNCTTNGRPQPTITWYDSNGVVLSRTESLILSDQMLSYPQPIQCSCKAENSVNGATYTASANTSFYVQSTNMNVQSAGTPGWAIAISVVIPLLAVAAAIIAGFLFYRHRKNKKQKSAKKKKPDSTIYTPVTTDPAVNANPNPTQPIAAPRISPTQLNNPSTSATGYRTPTGVMGALGEGYRTPTGGMGALGEGYRTPTGGMGALGAGYYSRYNTLLNTSTDSGPHNSKPAYPYNPRTGINPYPGARPSPIPPPGNPPYPYSGHATPRTASVDSSLCSGSTQVGEPTPIPSEYLNQQPRLNKTNSHDESSATEV